jgi:molybdopterin synthase catalytic subunit
MMRISSRVIQPDELRDQLTDPRAGAYVAFEGWIRNENEGHDVLRLEYESYEPLAVKEGERVLRETAEKFPILKSQCVHRVGMLEIGECAVWVGVAAPHREEAFAACRYIIDQVKVRLPIWKKEHYADGHSGWVNCERCAAHAEPAPSVVTGRHRP